MSRLFESFGVVLADLDRRHRPFEDFFAMNESIDMMAHEFTALEKRFCQLLDCVLDRSEKTLGFVAIGRVELIRRPIESK